MPMSGLTDSTMNQTNEIRILIAAMRLSSTSAADGTRPIALKRLPRPCEIGAAQTGKKAASPATFMPRMRKMLTMIPTIVHST